LLCFFFHFCFFPLVPSRQSFNHLTSWLADARQLAMTELTVVLVGNKCDKKQSREVTLIEASRFAQQNDLLFMETSALTGECVSEAFVKCTKAVLSKVESGVLDGDTLMPPTDMADISAEAVDSTGCAC
jgi:Ras-related protein Rab-4B